MDPAWIAGHSSIMISSRYVHPSEEAVLNAMTRLGGHNFGHSQRATEISAKNQLTLGQGEGWCARRDSNSRPNAPEANRLDRIKTCMLSLNFDNTIRNSQ